MRHLGDHAARCRRILQLSDAADAIQAEADQRLALIVPAPDRATGLFDPDFLRGGHGRVPTHSVAAAASPSVSRRRACSADTLTLRRAATERGESWCFNASKVARTML